MRLRVLWSDYCSLIFLNKSMSEHWNIWLHIDGEANWTKERIGKKDKTRETILDFLSKWPAPIFSPFYIEQTSFSRQSKSETKLLTEAKSTSRSMWLDFFVFPAIYFHLYLIGKEWSRLSKFHFWKLKIMVWY